MEDKKELTEKEIEEAALQSIHNFGVAENMWHEDYGWLIKNGVITEIGILFFKHLNKENE